MKVGIVIPIYCEQKNLMNLFQRITQVAATTVDIQWEFILVNDGSPDDSISVLRTLANADKRVKVIDLSRNFGKEVALTAGVHSVFSDAAICMDADLQHPPELIPRLVEECRKGAEVVATLRTGIDKQPIYIIRERLNAEKKWIASSLKIAT